MQSAKAVDVDSLFGNRTTVLSDEGYGQLPLKVAVMKVGYIDGRIFQHHRCEFRVQHAYHELHQAFSNLTSIGATPDRLQTRQGDQIPYERAKVPLVALLPWPIKPHRTARRHHRSMNVLTAREL